jgi:hypothetical protein
VNSTVIVILIVAVVAVAAAIFFYLQKQRSQNLHHKFGPEYERMVHTGDRSRAESELERRVKRVEKYRVHSLSRESQNQFAEAWRIEQARFVDDPKGAVEKADTLVAQVMTERGYPMNEFEERAADVSVDHPHVVEHYHAAHDIAQRAALGQANTEDLRNALIHYRLLFEDLLETRVMEHARDAREV